MWFVPSIPRIVINGMTPHFHKCNASGAVVWARPGLRQEPVQWLAHRDACEKQEVDDGAEGGHEVGEHERFLNESSRVRERERAHHCEMRFKDSFILYCSSFQSVRTKVHTGSDGVFFFFFTFLHLPNSNQTENFVPIIFSPKNFLP